MAERRNEPQSHINQDQGLFDPDQHPEATLRAFDEFTQRFELRYNAQYPDPPRVSLEAAIKRWTVQNATQENAEPKPDLQQYDSICEDWKSKDKVTKLLGMFTTARVYEDWKIAQPNSQTRKDIKWDAFITTMREHYKPTENITLKNFHFRALAQYSTESFPSYCSRVEKEAKHCEFKCPHADCNAENTAVRDQIIIGTSINEIREEALLKSWDLTTLRREGMQMESAMKGGAEMSNETVNRIGKYSYDNIKNENKNLPMRNRNTWKTLTCYNCGRKVSTDIRKHVRDQCSAIKAKCDNCSRTGHFTQMCKSRKEVRQLNPQIAEPDKEVYNLNLFIIRSSANQDRPHMASGIHNKSDFKVDVMLNNHFSTVIADTGAKVSVCGTKEAKKWNLLDKMVPSRTSIKPYKSQPIPVYGIARCAVTFGTTSVPVEWHLISGSCEPVLAGDKALQLGIINFTPNPEMFQPVNMIQSDEKKSLQNIISDFPHNFTGLGKLKNHKIKLHVDHNIKPVNVPSRPIPYHLKQRAADAIKEMIDQGVIEEHPNTEPAPWISNAVLTPKPDGTIRVTLDARNVNKAIRSSNLPIPRHDEIKAKLSGCKYFSKMDFKSAFWQLELDEESRGLTVFHWEDHKLYRHTRLTMGIKSAQGELNAALLPLFSHISPAHLIHDDLIIAAKTKKDHDEALQQVMLVIEHAGLTLNPKKCLFGKNQIEFWGMIIGEDGIKPNPTKVDALDYITPPTDKTSLISFICMMQSNSEFIPHFARKAAKLRELTKKNTRFQWTKEHQDCFEELLKSFTKDALLRYFDIAKQTYVITDAHKTGLGATLAQGESLETARPVAFASRTTSKAEKNYPQLDIEAMGVDFALRRFRNYLVGAPDTVTVVTDHQPLCSVFNGNRSGSVRTERIKLRHQDIRFTVMYRKGVENQSDYMSRHAKPMQLLPQEEQEEADDLNNLLYTLHSTPIMDNIGLASIAKHTGTDPTLKEVRTLIQAGKTWIPKTAAPGLLHFQKILPQITVTGNGILLKEERIILPEALQMSAIRLAHQGSHPGQSGLQRRLRFHFFFHDMNRKVEEWVTSCSLCGTFSNKKTLEPIQHHEVPKTCWSTVAVDLFGPLPSSHHIVVVQDLSSRFPAARIVSSTKADKVIPALQDIYTNYGNPEQQITDNGPPFNSKAMDMFTSGRDIQQQKTPPLHPSSNPAETFMRPLGKTMKIAHNQHVPEKQALEQLLCNYRDTPHPATGITPANMLFRDGYRTTFPRTSISDDQVTAARVRDTERKYDNEQKVNHSKYRKPMYFQVGDIVMIKNYKKTSKFQPQFLPEACTVIQVGQGGHRIVVERENDGMKLERHPDDIKHFLTDKGHQVDTTSTLVPEEEAARSWHNKFRQLMDMYEPSQSETNWLHHSLSNESRRPGGLAPDAQEENAHMPELRRSTRARTLNTRYYNDDIVNH